MTRKANAISTLARETMARIVGSPAEWESFLRSAARMYKYAFPEQVLIYAQRPNATACATLEQWNRCRYRRWVKPGAVGIALLEDAGPQLGLKYVFDLSDTRQTPYSQPFSTWAYRPEYEEAVLESLENHFGEVEGTGFSRRLHAIVGNLVEDNAAEYAAALQGGVAGSYLGDTDPPVLLELLKLAAAPSVEYMILCRLGLPAAPIGEVDMQAVTLFNTLETAAQLGAAVSDIAKMALGRIERTVKSIEKEAGTFAKSERVTENELEEEIKRSVGYGTDIPAGGQLPDSRLDVGTGAGSAGQVRDAAQAVPEGAPEGDIRRVIAERDAASPSVGGGPDSPNPGGTDHAGTGQGRGGARGTEGPRSAGMDRPDEQHPPAGRGAGHGADLQLEETNERPEALKSPGLSLSALAGVEEQMANILAAEHPGPFAIPQGEIDHVLRRGSGFQNGKLRIFQHYQQAYPLQERAAFLKKEYGIGGSSHVFTNGRKGNIWYDGKGLCISRDSGSAFSNPDLRISWRKAAQRIGELIAQGQYLTEGEQAQLAQYQEAQPVDRPQASQETMALAQEERSRQPGEYRLSLGDSVFLHGQEHFILAMAGELVELTDPQYPLLTVSYPHEQFIRLLGQDKRNDRLLAPEQRNDLGIHTADLLPEQVSPALDGPAPDSKQKRTPKTTAARNFDRLMALAPELLTGEAFYLRFTAGDAFMPLSMDYLGENRISISHTYLQNGDLMADPDMEFVFDLENKTLSARTFQQDGIGLYQTVENQQGEVDNPDLERQLNSFARQWFDNIQSQDYRRQRMHVRYHEVDFEAIYGQEGQIVSFGGWDRDGGQPHDEWFAAVRGYAKEHGILYSLGYGSLGNGTTVWNILEEAGHDYRTIAHIGTDGLVQAYTPLPDYILAEIQRVAQAEQQRAQQNPPVPFPATSAEEATEEQPAGKPERQSEHEAIYPAEQNNLPFDVVVERMHIPDGKPDKAPALDYRIADDALGHGGPKAKFRMNLEAIRTLGKIEGENRRATQQEQEILSRYVGWGGIPQAFDPNNSAWASEYAELKAALTETEYESARASTLNAHYTSPIVIKAVYQAIENLGFQRGNILEPSCGVGNFFGLLPDNMADSKRYGVELDAITGRIARQLYQNADIQIKGFEDADYPDNFFDLAIGNVPFGSYGVSDQRYDKYKFHIHDYFFAKAIDKVRPGGVVAFITSKGTLDKQDEKVRRYLAERAELLGAIRLPNNAFAANANTEVTADILFLRKRERPILSQPEWLHLGQTEDGIPINSYFLSHPEMLLGRMAWCKNMYGNENETACLPLEGKDLAAQLAEAISHIRGQIQSWELEEAGEQGEWLPADPSIPNFSFGLLEGNLYYRMDSQMQPAAASATALARIRAMIGLRECTRRLMQYQLENHPEARIRQEQERLNALYDRFVEQYGRITSRGNKSAFRDDASYPLLCSLEVLDEEGKFQHKAAMFTRRTIRAQTPVSHVDTPEEALALSIGERARVDIAYMAALTGLEEAALIQQLQGHIYRDLDSLDPSDMDWAAFDIRSLPFLTADAYLSGDVRHKLRQANALLEGLTRHSPQPEPETLQTLQAQILALQAVQPKDLEAGDIEVRLGSTWIPPEVVETFMYGLLNTPSYRRNKIKVLFSPYTAIWSVTGKSADFDNNNAILKYGTHRVNAYKILEESLNLRDVRVLDTVTIDGKETRLLNQKETIIAQQKQQAIQDAFQSWIWKDTERREQLVKRYNEKFNAIRPREYDGSHIQFHGMNPEIQLRPHQKNAVARILYGGNTLLGHVVGSGKTFTMAAAAMELRRLGLCHKPMFVVPNHLTDQWAGEFLQLYPAANILVTTRRDFERQNRQRIFSRIATGEYDAVIIGHSQFEKLPVSQERQQAHLAEQIDQVIRGISEAKAKNAEPFTIKQMERTKKQLQTKLERLNHTERKDRVITFEELGVDRLFVDEAHSFKNLAAFSKMRNVAGISQAEAQKSSDMFMKCRYLDDLTGNRGVIFATGTPISNTMVEMYTMQRYLQYDALVQRGLAHFDAWASTFGETITAMELAPEGTGFRLRTRFARFFNLPELTSMFREVADIQTADMLKLPVPKVEYHTEVLEPSKFQRDMLLSLADRAEAVRAGSVKPTEDNMLRITGDGRKLALDQRMLNSLLPDDPMSKANACVDHVLRIWQDTAAEKLTQLLFCDLSTPKGEGFHVYQDIKAKLIQGGIPEQEIAFIHDADSEAQKVALFSKVRSGSVRVLLGSTAKMGAGTNVQRLLVAEHHLDCPWRPADIEQREGRIIRQGNQNGTVHIYRYVTKDTFDAYMWATLEAKQRFISQVMTSRSPARSCEDMDEQTLSYAEVKSLATGDPRIKERMDLEMEISKLKLLRASHMNQRFEMQSRLQRIPLEIQSYEQAREKLAADHASYMQNKAGDFSMTICGTRYAERKDAGAALLSACQAKTDPAPKEIGAYRGFRLLLAYANMQFTAILKGEGSYSVELGDTAIGNIQRLEHQLERLAPSVKAADCKIDALKQEQQTLEADAEQPFSQEAELTEKSQRLIALDAALKLKTHADRVQDTEIDQEETPSQAREEYVR